MHFLSPIIIDYQVVGIAGPSTFHKQQGSTMVISPPQKRLCMCVCGGAVTACLSRFFKVVATAFFVKTH